MGGSLVDGSHPDTVSHYTVTLPTMKGHTTQSHFTVTLHSHTAHNERSHFTVTLDSHNAQSEPSNCIFHITGFSGVHKIW